MWLCKGVGMNFNPLLNTLYSNLLRVLEERLTTLFLSVLDKLLQKLESLFPSLSLQDLLDLFATELPLSITFL